MFPFVNNILLITVQERVGLKHVNVGELIKEHKCYEGFDTELDTNVLDEDKLLDSLEIILDNLLDIRLIHLVFLNKYYVHANRKNVCCDWGQNCIVIHVEHLKGFLTLQQWKTVGNILSQVK